MLFVVEHRKFSPVVVTNNSTISGKQSEKANSADSLTLNIWVYNTRADHKRILKRRSQKKKK